MRKEKKIREITKSKLFRKFFFSYFIIIFFSVSIISTMIYYYSEKIVAEEAVKSNIAVMRNVASEVEEFMSLLTDDTINLLSQDCVSNLTLSDIKLHGKEPNEMFDSLSTIKEVQHSVKAIFNSKKIIDDIYTVYLDGRNVIRYDGLYSLDNFLSYTHHIEDEEREEFFLNISQKQMMKHYPPQVVSQVGYMADTIVSSKTVIPIATSYPFGSEPKVVVVTDLKIDWLKERIDLSEYGNIDTLIFDKSNNLLVHSGEMNIDVEQLVNEINGNYDIDLIRVNGEEYRVALVYSDINGWSYLSLINERELMQPVSLIKTTVAILFTSFIIFGLLVSFFLGRKMYSPIKMIRDKLYGQAAIRHENFVSASSSSNELEYIDKWYTEIINDFQKMNQKIDEMRPTIIEHTLLRIIKGQINDFEVVNNYMDSSDRIEPGFDKLLMVVECIFSDELKKEVSIKDKGLYKRKLKGLVSNIGEKIYTIDISENTIALLWVLKEKPHDVQYYTGLIVQVLDTIETASVKHVLAVHEEFINTEEQTADAFAICTKLLDYRLLTKENEVITENNMEKRIYGDTYLSEDHVSQLRSKKSSEEITAYIIDILDFYYHTAKVERNIKQISIDILNVIMRTSVNPSKPNLEKIVEYTALIGKCHTLSEIKMLFENACKHINLHTETHEAENPGAVMQESAIQEVMEYIKENYNKDLSLEYFADKYNISVGHFSRCFKNYSGYKYVDYVNHCRLDKAKTLLIETDMLISEISEEVGYIGKNTFNATFKRYEGITPGKYRTDYRGQQNISIKADYKTSNYHNYFVNKTF